MESRPSYQDISRTVRAGNLERVRELINSHGLSYSQEWSQGYFLLRHALRNQHAAVAKLLLANDSAVNGETTKPLDTPLHLAVKNGDIEIVNMILEKGANIEARNESGLTPLHVAIERGTLQIAKDLLKYGADTNCRCIKWKKDYTPLHFAAENGYICITECLLSYGACIYSSTLEEGYTPLHIATINGHEKVVKLLLQHGAKVDNQDEYGRTILHLAVEKGNSIIVEDVLKYCPDINNRSNRNSFEIAVHGNGEEYKKIVEALLEYGFIVDSENANDPHFLCAAVQKGYLKIVEDLLKCGAVINASDRYGRTLLHFTAKGVASDDSAGEIAKLLLSKGAHVDARTKNGETALYIAIQKGYAKVVEVLLDHNANVICGERSDVTSLHLSARRENAKITRILLNGGANVNAEQEDGSTALHIAAGEGHKEVVKVLLQYGAKVDSKNKNGTTPLHIAAEKGHKEVVKVLLECDAKVNSEMDNGTTPLHIAAQKGHEEVVKVLLECGAKVDSEMEDGTTPLHIAAQKCPKELVNVLLEYGAKVDSEMENGTTPLHIAAEKGHKEVVKVLLECGAKVDSKNKNGTTPLHQAAGMDHQEIIDTLLKFGANINSRDESGGTALHIASRRGCNEVVEFLLEYGSNINSTWKNRTPLDYALAEIINKFDFDYGSRWHPCNGSRRYKAVAKSLTRYIVKMKTTNSSVSERNLQSLNSSKKMSDFRDKCEEEIARMKSEKIDNTNISFRDIMVKDTNSVAKNLRNDNIVQVLESNDYKTQFPIYAEMIERNFRKGIQRKELREQGNESLHILFNNLPKLPYDCFEEIIRYLSDEDLRNVTDACKPLDISDPNTDIDDAVIPSSSTQVQHKLRKNR